MPFCRQCSSAFEVTAFDCALFDKLSPVFGGKKYSLSSPSHCPDCRMRRRLAFRNDRSLYRSVSKLSGKQIISMYHPDRRFVVYDQHEWWSDAWDPLEYGVPFSESTSFFQQFSALQSRVPRFNIFNLDSENCDYVNYTPHCRNCFLLFGSWFDEDCCYGQTLTECRSCFDALFIEKSELCYECIDCSGYRLLFSFNCHNCTDSAFCYDCKGCTNCFGCWNLRNRENHLFNQPATKDEVVKARAGLQSYENVQRQWSRFLALKQSRAIHQATTGIKNENSSGDFLFECKNVRQCFSAYRCQDLAYCSRLMDMKDGLDFEGGGKGELVYESMSNDFAFRSIGSMTSEHLTEAHYCDLCFECKNCFGCVGLRHKQYCVLNTQYTKEEYETLVPRIIDHMKRSGEWGEFFPIDISPFAYNETMAQEYFPLPKEEVEKHGWRWREQADEMPKVSKVIPADKLPDSIADVPDDILQWAVTCETTRRPFKIIKQELAFYRSMGLPVPRLHPDERHRRRMMLRNPRHLWDRQCAKCQKPMASSYAPERPEIVYCESCYLASVY